MSEAYTIGLTDPAYGMYEDRATWLGVNCADPLSPTMLDHLDRLLELRRAGVAVGLRCICHEWWNCGRSFCADYLMHQGTTEVIHLGEIVWRHSLYVSGHWKRYTDEQMAAWSERRTT